jgi:hypothetical protein
MSLVVLATKTEFSFETSRTAWGEIGPAAGPAHADAASSTPFLFNRMNANLVETTAKHSHLQCIATLAFTSLGRANV